MAKTKNHCYKYFIIKKLYHLKGSSRKLKKYFPDYPFLKFWMLIFNVKQCQMSLH